MSVSVIYLVSRKNIALTAQRDNIPDYYGTSNAVTQSAHPMMQPDLIALVLAITDIFANILVNRKSKTNTRAAISSKYIGPTSMHLQAGRNVLQEPQLV